MSSKQHKDSLYEKQCKAMRKKAKRRAGTARFIMTAFTLAALVCAYAFVLAPTYKYQAASENLTAENWQAAFEGFSALGSFKDSRALSEYANCMNLFTSGQISAASEAYLQLDESGKARINDTLGSFTRLADASIESGSYADAYLYYSLDFDNPERDDAMYAISVYLDCESLLNENRYAEARSEITACLEQSHALSVPLQELMDGSYASEFNYYDSFTKTDLAFAVEGMHTLCDEYEPAHVYLRDLGSAYMGGVISMNEGKYTDAIAQFSDIVSYSDCAEKIDRCYVLLANQQAEAGNEDAALRTVQMVSNWQEYMDILPEDSSLSSLLLAQSTPSEDSDELNA